MQPAVIACPIYFFQTLDPSGFVSPFFSGFTKYLIDVMIILARFCGVNNEKSLHLLNALVHPLRLFSVIAHEKCPKDKRHSNLNCRDHNSLENRSGTTQPADGISNDRVYHAPDSHVDQYPDRHWQIVFLVYDRWESKSQAYHNTACDHLRKPIIIQTEIPTVCNIKNNSCQAKDRQCTSDTHNRSADHIFRYLFHCSSPPIIQDIF